MKKTLLSLVVVAALAACGGGTTTPTYKATLSPANEVPAVTGTTGTGSVTGTLSGTTLTVTGTYATLSGAAQAAHIHTGAAGTSGGVFCSLTVTEGTTAGTGTLSGTCPAIVVTDLDAQNLYVNVHTVAHGGGELRGQLIKQ